MPASELEVCFGRGMSYVTRMRATYPYKFLKSNISNGLYTIVFLLGYGGGIVSGDRQELRITVNENAVLILKTQGSTKIFKGINERYTSQEIVANISSGSLLAFLADPTTCFNGSKYTQHQIYNLEEGASLVLCDWYTSGRMSRGEAWLLERLQTKLEIFISGKQIFFEKLDLHDTEGIASAADKVGNASVFGCVVLIGPYTALIRARVSTIMQRQTYRQKQESNSTSMRNKEIEKKNYIERISSIVAPNEPLVSVSSLCNDASILRFAADSTEDAYQLLAEVLKPLATGGLSSLPKPFMDRIHSLNTEEFNSSVITSIGAKRHIDDVNDDSPTKLSTPPGNPLNSATSKLGSAIQAMRRYDHQKGLSNDRSSIGRINLSSDTA